jgi:tubulin-specific chaperone B
MPTPTTPTTDPSSSSRQQQEQQQQPVIKNHDLLALQAYITAVDATQYNAVDDALVILDLTHSNLQQQHIEIRFHKADRLATLRQRIHQKTGTPPCDQHLQVMDDMLVGSENNEHGIAVEIPPTTADSYLLGYFGLLHHGMRVHCIDLNPLSGSSGGAYEDTSLVSKYVMDDDAYNARSGTLRDWGRRQREQNPHFTLRQHAEHHRQLAEATRQHKLGLPLPDGFFLDATGKIVRDEPDVVEAVVGTKNTQTDDDNEQEEEEDSEFGLESVDSIKVDGRCEVEPGKRRGRVAFVGKVSQLGSGYWVGVVFDEPVGQNDGSISETGDTSADKSRIRLFETPGPRYGGIVRGKNVKTGDYPERDLLDSDDDDSEDEL